MNSIVLIGRITHSLELKMTKNGKAVCSFDVAVNRSFGGEKVADFFSIVTWGKTAEFVTKYFSKGDQIAIQGELQTRKYEGRDGTSKTAYEIMASQVAFCGGKKEKTEATGDIPGDMFPEVKELEEDLPF